MAAGHLLGDSLDPGHPAAQDALDRWEKVDRAARPGLWRLCFISSCLLVAAVLSAFHIRDLPNYRESIAAFMNLHPVSRNASEVEGMAPEQKYLYGHPELSRLENALRLWQTNPENPAYYARYTTAFINEHERLPEDHFDVVRRIDPENSWFYYQAAGRIGKDSVKSKGQSHAQGDAGDFVAWEILDAAGMEEALKLFQKAARLPGYNSYEMELISDLIRLVTPVDSPPELIHALLRVVREEIGFSDLLSATYIAAAHARTLEMQGDEEALVSHAADCEAFLRAMLGPPEWTLLYGVVLQSTVFHMTESLHQSAENLGLEHEAAHWGKRHEVLGKRSEDRKRRAEGMDDLRPYQGVLGGYAFFHASHLVENPPSCAFEDLAPIRNTERALFSRGLAISSALLFGLFMLILFVSRWKHSRLIRGLSARAESLLGASDWYRIFGIGVMLPIFSFFLLHHFTPLGGHQYGIDHPSFQANAYPFLVMVLTCTSVSLGIADRCVRRHMAAFQLPRSLAGTGWWLFTAAGAGYLLIHGWLPGSDAMGGIVESLTGMHPAYDAIQSANDLLMFLLAGLFLLLAFRSFFHRTAGFLVQATVNRALLPAFSFAILVMSLTLPALRSWEISSLKADRMFTPDPDHPAITPWETAIARQFRKELREDLGIVD